MADDTIRTERVNITIRGKKGRRTKAHVRGKGPRYGPFTRPVEDDPITTLSDVLWVYKDAIGLRAFDFTNKAAPSKPIDSLEVGGIISQKIQNKRAVFDSSSLVTATKKTPVFVSTLPFDDTPTGVVGDVTIWVETDRSMFSPTARLLAFDVTNINTPTPIVSYDLTSAFATTQENIHANTPDIGVAGDGNHVYIVGADRLSGAPGQLTLCAYNTTNPLSVIQGTPQSLGFTPNDVSSGNALFQSAPSIVIDDVLHIGYTVGTSPLGFPPYQAYVATYSLADPMNPLLTNLYPVTDFYGVDPALSQSPIAIHVNKARTRMVVLTTFYIVGSPPVAGIGDPFLLLFDLSSGPTTPVLTDRISITNRVFLDPTPTYLQFSDVYIVGNLVYASKDFGTTSPDMAIYDVSDGTFNLINTIDMQSDAGGGPLRSILGLSIGKKGEPLSD